MPKSALEQVPSAHVLRLSEIPNLLVRLVGEDLSVQGSYKRQRADNAVKETRISEFNMSEIANENCLGHPSVFGCPDCGGVLWDIEHNGFLHFRCRIGHAYTASHLNAEQRHGIETALWAALRVLEESASLYRRMADRAGKFNHDLTAQQFQSRATNTDDNARILREFLLSVNRIQSRRRCFRQCFVWPQFAIRDRQK